MGCRELLLSRTHERKALSDQLSPPCLVGVQERHLTFLSYIYHFRSVSLRALDKSSAPCLEHQWFEISWRQWRGASLSEGAHHGQHRARLCWLRGPFVSGARPAARDPLGFPCGQERSPAGTACQSLRLLSCHTGRASRS